MYTIFSIHDGQSRLTFCKSSREIFKNSIETIVFPVIPYKRVFRIQFLVIPCFKLKYIVILHNKRAFGGIGYGHSMHTTPSRIIDIPFKVKIIFLFQRMIYHCRID